MKDSKSALRIKKLIAIFLVLVALSANISLFVFSGEQIQVATIQNKIQEEVSIEDKNMEEVQVATVNSKERIKSVTTRASQERTVEEQSMSEPEVTYIRIEEIKISKDMDLTVRCGVSKEDFIKLMENLKVDYSGFFERNAGTIYDLCEKYEINEIFFCGLIAAESGWNIASNHRNTHNYISMMSRNGLIHYSSDEEGLEAAAKLLHNKYLTPGGGCYHGKTLSGVQRCFCPNSSTWVGLVYGCMKQVVK